MAPVFDIKYIDVESESKSEDLNLIYVDLLVKVKDEAIIYRGLLEDFYLSPDGGIETIWISEANYRAFNTKTESDSEAFKYVNGQIMSFPYSEILNINVRYYLVEKDESADDEDLETTNKSKNKTKINTSIRNLIPNIRRSLNKKLEDVDI